VRHDDCIEERESRVAGSIGAGAGNWSGCAIYNGIGHDAGEYARGAAGSGDYACGRGYFGSGSADIAGDGADGE
jgi:hypothetical protein